MKRKLFGCYVSFFILTAGVVCAATFSLSSCSYKEPEFHTPPDQNNLSWIESDFSVRAYWHGFYIEDIDEPWLPSDKNGIEFNGNEDKIEVITDSEYTHKWIDKTTQDNCIEIWFHIKNSKSISDIDAQPFAININWTIKHTAIKKHTKLTINPYSTIQLHNTYYADSMPSPSNDYVGDNVNSINCIDSLYNMKNGGKIENIYGNLLSDFCYLTYLMFQTHKHITLDTIPVIGEVYIEGKQNSNSSVAVDLEYDQNTQIFKYIQIRFTLEVDVHFGIIESNSGTCHFDMDWTGPEGGPKLLGGYTMSGNEKQTHFAQTPPAEYPQWTQNFLSLVPSTYNSFMLYRFWGRYGGGQYPEQYFDGGWHTYVLNQTRGFGLEIGNGHNHLTIGPNNGIFGDHDDGFRNMGIFIPSCSLSGIAYNPINKNWYQKHLQKIIKKCKTNINQIIPPQFKNYINPDKAVFAKSWLNGYSKINQFANSLDDSDQTIDPTSFVVACRNEFNAWRRCVEDENTPQWTANIIDPDTNEVLLDNVPWYQIIQQESDGYPPDPDCSFSIGANCFAGYSDCLFGPNYGAHNIVVDINTSNFSRIAFGLNYALTCDDIDPNSDNVFAYNDTLLQAINDMYDGSPTS